MGSLRKFEEYGNRIEGQNRRTYCSCWVNIAGLFSKFDRHKTLLIRKLRGDWVHSTHNRVMWYGERHTRARPINIMHIYLEYLGISFQQYNERKYTTEHNWQAIVWMHCTKCMTLFIDFDLIFSVHSQNAYRSQTQTGSFNVMVGCARDLGQIASKSHSLSILNKIIVSHLLFACCAAVTTMATRNSGTSLMYLVLKLLLKDPTENMVMLFNFACTVVRFSLSLSYSMGN